MKIAFNILPVITDYENVNLLVEAGNYGISFVWFKKDPLNVLGISVYHLTDRMLPGEVADEIEKTLHASPVFNKIHASITICYDFKESMLVPELYHKPAKTAEMLNLVYATDNDYNVKTEDVKRYNVVNIYAVHKKIEEVLARQFPYAVIYHSTSLQLEKIHTLDKYLYCIFSHNSIKVIMFNGNAIQLVQHFNYNTPVDAAYHLLNCCKQFDFKPSEVSLMLSGMIDEISKLYTELYRYFLKIEFEKIDEGIVYHDRIKFYPSHFFSHLTGLVTCVS